MNAKELYEKLNGMSEVKGADISINEAHQQIEIYAFHKTADFKACKAALESLGFACMPNSGFWQGEVEEKPAQKLTMSSEQFEQMVRGN